MEKKELNKYQLQDEIISIIINYIQYENNELERAIKTLAKGRIIK